MLESITPYYLIEYFSESKIYKLQGCTKHLVNFKSTKFQKRMKSSRKKKKRILLKA